MRSALFTVSVALCTLLKLAVTLNPRSINLEFETEILINKNKNSVLRVIDKLEQMLMNLKQNINHNEKNSMSMNKEWDFAVDFGSKNNVRNKINDDTSKHRNRVAAAPADVDSPQLPSHQLGPQRNFTNFMLDMLRILDTDKKNKLSQYAKTFDAMIDDYAASSALSLLGEPFVTLLENGATYSINLKPYQLHEACRMLYKVILNRKTLNREGGDMMDAIDAQYTEKERENMDKILEDVKKDNTNKRDNIANILNDVILEPFLRQSITDRNIFVASLSELIRSSQIYQIFKGMRPMKPKSVDHEIEATTENIKESEDEKVIDNFDHVTPKNVRPTIITANINKMTKVEEIEDETEEESVEDNAHETKPISKTTKSPLPRSTIKIKNNKSENMNKNNEADADFNWLKIMEFVKDLIIRSSN